MCSCLGTLTTDYVDLSIYDRTFGPGLIGTQFNYVTYHRGPGHSCPLATGSGWYQYACDFHGKWEHSWENINNFGPTLITNNDSDPAPTSVVDCVVSIVTPAGTHTCGGDTAADWPHVWVGSQSEAISITAKFSYTGDGGYYSNETNDSTNVETVGGYPAKYGGTLTSSRLFVGWA